MLKQVTKKMLMDLGAKNVISVKNKVSLLLNGGIGTPRMRIYNSLEEIKNSDWFKESDVIVIRHYNKKDWKKRTEKTHSKRITTSNDGKLETNVEQTEVDQYLVSLFTFCNWEGSLNWEESPDFISRTENCVLQPVNSN